MKSSIFALLGMLFSNPSMGSDLKVHDSAPLFTLKNHEGKDFQLLSRKGHWTVLYFYPKSETPGCTKQACAFRDTIDKIRTLDADVFGVSVNSVSDQDAFRKHHHLNFDLLADDGTVAVQYGTKMPVLNMSKRWTFILDRDLVIQDIEKDVDPVKDAEKVVKKIKDLQKNETPKSK